MLNEAFDALKNYDWGTDIATIAPIDDAVAAAHDNPGARKELEDRLLAALKSDISRDAKDYVCRKLAIIGSATAVPTLAALLTDKNHSHMSRFALQNLPADEAAQALRGALSKASGNVKVGIISSIGARRDTAAVPALAGLLVDADATVARAAAIALGDIGTVEAANVLFAAKPGVAALISIVTDALLACAESLLAENKPNSARAIYASLSEPSQNRLVRLAATRGMLACAAKNT
jgi:HEAT repeat protein